MAKLKKKKLAVGKTKQVFVCSACGYDAYKMAKLSHCPLCIICRGCKQRIAKCHCIERE